MITLALGLVPGASASEIADTFQMHGFMSQALIVSDHNDFFGPSSEEGGSLEYTELGLNVSTRPSQNMLLAAQVLARKAGQGSSITDPELDYGVLDYQLLADGNRTMGIQTGRFKNPFGFYNLTRDIPSTRPGVLLPQSIYFDRTRSVGLSSDGLLLYEEERLSSGTLRFQAGVGKPRLNSDAEYTLMTAGKQPSLDGRTSWIGQVRYEHAGGRFIAALSAAWVNADLDTRMAGSGDFSFQPWILSLQYNREHWSLTAEYARRRLELDHFDRDGMNSNVTGESWYLQYTYRFLDNWQWLLRYDALISNRDDPSGRTYEAAGLGPAHSRFARDITTGLRWRISSGWLLEAEWHHVDGTGWLPLRDNLERDDTDRYWNMLLLQTSFLF
ncbi:hypothetical protein C7446_1598 [Kushneria sinocarnis]|uniref:Phosphate-selective porin O/P n=2 Tax=Kushneria sinocarnis TaxID=595502 RepID=A0A420WXA3_9GAMM|nr:hypothetical protein C7446_1598 [Kushneria sinocarnis]